MISCLLIQITRNAQGLPIGKDCVISGSVLQIGRGAACKIHLLDHRVSLLHASIKRAEDGSLYIYGERDVTLKVNGFITQSAPLLPDTHIEIGPYTFTVGANTDSHDLALSCELIHPLNTHDATFPKAATTLATLGLSKRKLGFSLAGIILVLFLLLPMLPGLSKPVDQWQAGHAIGMSGAWSPGPLSNGHALFEKKCSTCHQQPFQAVSDQVCTGCHKQVGQHLHPADMQSRTFHAMRCTSCHTDHQGGTRLILHDSAKCVSCHGNLKKKMSSTQRGDVHDFSQGHPPFSLTLWQGDKLVRLRQDGQQPAVEHSGLKYSHKVHLDPNGVSSPQGDTVMQCQDCHKLEDSGRHFAPMTMQKSCQQSGCHSLDFTEPVEGLAPHRSEHAVMDRLREFYLKWLADAPENREQCGPLQEVQDSLACADKLAYQNAASTLFRKNKECGECHEIQPTGDSEVPWKVAPVRINRDWQPGATFSHAKHNTTPCTDCHRKENSNSSADISMPEIKKCRECHAGSTAQTGKITSGCDTCHLFHQKPAIAPTP